MRIVHLQELSEHLVKEDPNVRPLRRALGFHNIIKEVHKNTFIAGTMILNSLINVNYILENRILY